MGKKLTILLGYGMLLYLPFVILAVLVVNYGVGPPCIVDSNDCFLTKHGTAVVGIILAGFPIMCCILYKVDGVTYDVCPGYD